MGYKILDCKRFLKLDDKFIPFILSGNNNCSDYRIINGKYREVREKNWSVFNQCHNEIPLFTREEIISAAKEEIALSNEFFYTKGHFQNGDEFLKMIINGLRSAYTIEEINEFSSVPISIFVHVLSDKTTERSFSEVIHSSVQLKKYFDLDEVKRILSEPGGWIYMSFSACDDPLVSALRKPCYRGLSKPKINKDNDFFYLYSVNINETYGCKYFCSLKGKGTDSCFTNELLQARQFKTRKDAQDYLNKHPNRFSIKIGYKQ